MPISPSRSTIWAIRRSAFPGDGFDLSELNASTILGLRSVKTDPPKNEALPRAPLPRGKPPLELTEQTMRQILPPILIAVAFGWFNLSLHNHHAPPTLERITLPYWNTFDSSNPEQITLEGQWQTQRGKLAPRTPSAGLQWPQAITPRTPYRLELKLELPDQARAALIFNAQTPGKLERSHRLVLERRGEDILIRAEYIGRNNEIKLEDERLIPHPERSLALRLQVIGRAYAIRLDGVSALAALPLKFDGGLIGLQARGLVRFDSLMLRRASDDIIAADRLGSASTKRVSGGWRELSGLWALEGIGITQRDKRDFDRTLMLEGERKPERIRLSLRHLAGAGAGLVFNTPKTVLEGGHLVRYAEDGKSLFWGVFQNKKFKGQGYAKVPVPGLTTHVIEVISSQGQYSVKLDGKILGSAKLERRSGRIGLTTSLSSAAFTGLDVTISGKRETVLP